MGLRKSELKRYIRVLEGVIMKLWKTYVDYYEDLGLEYGWHNEEEIEKLRSYTLDDIIKEVSKWIERPFHEIFLEKFEEYIKTKRI
mgnify:CR=1 FL=1